MYITKKKKKIRLREAKRREERTAAGHLPRHTSLTALADNFPAPLPHVGGTPAHAPTYVCVTVLRDDVCGAADVPGSDVRTCCAKILFYPHHSSQAVLPPFHRRVQCRCCNTVLQCAPGVSLAQPCILAEGVALSPRPLKAGTGIVPVPS